MLLNKAYYTFKFLLPRPLQIRLRRYYVNWKHLSMQLCKGLKLRVPS